MPNWVRNNITFLGKEKDIKSLLAFVKTDINDFDFNQIIPMPEELNLDEGSAAETAVACAKARKAGKKTCDRLDEWSLKERSFDEWADLGDKYLRNIETYGVRSWYDWRVSNWGTKWLPTNVCVNEYSVSFDTAWSFPEGIYSKLAELFPDVMIQVDFADEDLGTNCGRAGFNGFEPCTTWVEFVDDIEFACDVWGYDYEEIKEMQKELF